MLRETPCCIAVSVDPSVLYFSILQLKVNSFICTADANQYTVKRALLLNRAIDHWPRPRNTREGNDLSTDILVLIDKPCRVVLSEKAVYLGLCFASFGTSITALYTLKIGRNLWNFFVINASNNLGTARLERLEVYTSFVTEHRGQILHVLRQPSHWNGLGSVGFDVKRVTLTHSNPQRGPDIKPRVYLNI